MPTSLVKLTENVYENLPDGRTILAGTAGDEIEAARAEQLGVGADGKSTSGVGPPTAPRPFGATVDSDTAVAADPGLLLDGKVDDVKTRIAAAGSLEALDAALAAEKAKKKPRKGVLEALEARHEQLREEEDDRAAAAADARVSAYTEEQLDALETEIEERDEPADGDEDLREAIERRREALEAEDEGGEA